MKPKRVRLNRIIIGLVLILMALILYPPMGILGQVESAEEPVYTYLWNGQGKNSLDCGKAGEGARPVDGTGWIHWIFATKGASSGAILTLGGSGSGTYYPAEPLGASTWHFYTPYFDVYTLTASVTLTGGAKGPGVGLVISDYCPGEEKIDPMLTIKKELLDIAGESIVNSDIQFEFIISGGDFGDEGRIYNFSVNSPRELGPDDGLQFYVPYTIKEIVNAQYETISISPGEVTLTEETPGNAVTVTITNREKEEELGSIIIKKLIKVNVDDEDVIPSTKIFTFNIYNNATNELVRSGIQVNVENGKGSVTVKNLPLMVYRVEEVVNGGYAVTLYPAGGIVDLTKEDNEVTIVVTNTPRPQLIIRKVLQDTNGVPVASSNIDFKVTLDGGTFVSKVINFSVNKPAVLDHTDGLQFNVPYTLKEMININYPFVIMNPYGPFTLTDEQNVVTVTVTNRIPPPPPPPPPPVEEEETEPVERLAIEPEAPMTDPPQVEDPETEPISLLIVEPERPLATPRTGGMILALTSLGIVLIGSGLILRSHKEK